ncbi:hypothetical protein HZB01_03235 [Candidatus Woesearchaeota archaeon]|nr:hypothetical protein [Candidatus Woesearchaeota archaeon]
MAAISVNCKQCGRPSPSTDFVLDPYYGMMVCAACVKARKQQASITQSREKAKADAAAHALQEQQKGKPAGWDAEDEYLEKMGRFRKTETAPTGETQGKEKLNKTCHKCQYAYVYNTVTRFPRSCPYCGAQIVL